MPGTPKPIGDISGSVDESDIYASSKNQIYRKSSGIWAADRSVGFAVRPSNSIWSNADASRVLTHGGFGRETWEKVGGSWVYGSAENFDGHAIVGFDASAFEIFAAATSRTGIKPGQLWQYDGAPNPRFGVLKATSGIDYTQFYAIWGTAPNDLFIASGRVYAQPTVIGVPTAGLGTGYIFHWDGGTLSDLSGLIDEHLFGISGTASNDV